MGAFIDLTGQIFGRLTVIKYLGKSKGETRCECGEVRVNSGYDLKIGKVKSCGCLSKERTAKLQLKHGCGCLPPYKIWNNMMTRCYNKNSPSYKHYGARGVKVCGEWRKSPKNFIIWAIRNGWQKNLQIDRKNNDGDYTPENCHFVTPAENNHNQRLISSSNKSGYSGVSFDRGRGLFMASIKHLRKNHYVGRFKTAKEAAIARDQKVIREGWPHNLNFTHEELQTYINTKK